MFSDRTPKQRWPRTQKFTLSERGRSAGELYLSDIVAARAEAGRSSFDAARAAWAAQFQIEPDDGLYLAELASSPMTLERMVAALETCGKTKKDASESMGRLFDTGLIVRSDE
jgi:hypothetical protein